MGRTAWIRLLTAVCLLSMSVPVWSAKFNRVLEIGDTAPDWKDLPGTDGARHGLTEYKDARIVVVCFYRNNCPVAQGYERRIIEFTKRYRDQGVAVVAINASHAAGETLEKMKMRAEQRNFDFAYLRDETQQTARAYGATVTPHLFVLDRDRKIAYMGAFDDQNQQDNVTRHYLIDAVDSLLAGKPVTVPESLQRGCAIGYEGGANSDGASKSKSPQ